MQGSPMTNRSIARSTILAAVFRLAESSTADRVEDALEGALEQARAAIQGATTP
jgi:hypothetical protein